MVPPGYHTHPTVTGQCLITYPQDTPPFYFFFFFNSFLHKMEQWVEVDCIVIVVVKSSETDKASHPHFLERRDDQDQPSGAHP